MTTRDLLIAAAILLTVSCGDVGGSVPTGNPKVDGLAWSLCTEYGVLCVGSSTKEEFGADEALEGFYWGRTWYGEIELPELESGIEYSLVCWDDAKCAEDLNTCAGVILHEIGHTRVGGDQSEADCWAIQHATKAEGVALRDLVCRLGDRPRCQAIEECIGAQG